MVDAADLPGAGRVLESRLAAIVQDTHDAIIAKDLRGVITAWNEAAVRMYGYASEEAVGRHISILIPDDHAREEEVILERIRRDERIETYETERIRKDGVRIDVALTISPIKDAAGSITGASVVARDVTDETRRRHAQAFLARVASTFHTSLEPLETARTIAESAVPELGELCVLDFVLADGAIGDATVVAEDAKVAAGLQELRRSAPIDPEGSHPVAEVLRTGRPLVLRDLTAPGIRARVAQSDAHAQFIASSDYKSAVVVPLVGRRGLLGALSLLHVQNDRRYDDGDLELLEDIGARAGLAIENARVHHERSKVANILQRSLRPDAPVEIPGVELGVVYEPVGEGIEVGGDFYDLFETGEGWFLLIGDVVGKGPEAAALTGQIRHTVRALALPGWTPQRVLRRVNEILCESLSGGEFASAQLLFLRRWRDGRVDAELASAGHPPAAVHSRGGVGAVGGGTVLGVLAEAQVSSTRLSLDQGDVLVLYTDGWLDAGPSPGHRSPEDLASVLGRDSDRPVGNLLAELTEDALDRAGGDLEDDLVLLGLRVVGVPVSDFAGDEVTVDLAAGPETGHEARRHLTSRLADRLTAELLHDLATVVNELVNNAVEHGLGERVTVRVSVGKDGSIHGAVGSHDGAAAAARIRKWSPSGEGLGLRIVDYLAERWGVGEGGTEVWFELRPAEGA